MNVRNGFHRLSMGVLFLAWALWLVFTVATIEEEAARRGEQFFYGLLMTAGYLGLCKGVAWVFNGFFPQQR
jgi:hypothetical protein